MWQRSWVRGGCSNTHPLLDVIGAEHWPARVDPNIQCILTFFLLNMNVVFHVKIGWLFLKIGLLSGTKCQNIHIIIVVSFTKEYTQVYLLCQMAVWMQRHLNSHAAASSQTHKNPPSVWDLELSGKRWLLSLRGHTRVGYAAATDRADRPYMRDCLTWTRVCYHLEFWGLGERHTPRLPSPPLWPGWGGGAPASEHSHLIYRSVETGDWQTHGHTAAAVAAVRRRRWVTGGVADDTRSVSSYRGRRAVASSHVVDRALASSCVVWCGVCVFAFGKYLKQVTKLLIFSACQAVIASYEGGRSK